MDNARLVELFGGRDRFRLLSQLYLAPARHFTNQELAERADVSPGNAHRWLKLWTELGLVQRHVSGRNITYRASDDPLLAGLSDIMLRHSALVDDIRAALPKSAEAAVLFGSAARGEEHARSDVDVLVLGNDLSSIRVNAALKPVARKHQREIHAVVYARREFEELLAREDSFARSVAASKRVPLKGSFDYGAA